MRHPKCFISAVVAMTLSASASVAFAAEVYFDTVSTEKAVRTHGAYFGAFGGVGVGGADVDFNKRLRGASLDKTEAAFGGVEFGYSFNTPLPLRPSIELELLYLDDELRAELLDARKRTASANLKLFNASINLMLALDLSMYNEDLGSFLAALHPYVGFGVGGAYAELDSYGLRNKRGRRVTSEGDQSGFEYSYQIFGGLELAFSDAFSIYAEYKYLAISNLGNGNINNYERPLLNFGFKVQY